MLKHEQYYYEWSPKSIIIFIFCFVFVVAMWVVLFEIDQTILSKKNRWHGNWPWDKIIEYQRKRNLSLMILDILFMLPFLYMIFGKYLFVYSILIVPICFRCMTFPNKTNVRRKICYLLKKIKDTKYSMKQYSPDLFDERLMWHSLFDSLMKLEGKILYYEDERKEMEKIFDKDWVKNPILYIISFRWLWKW